LRDDVKVLTKRIKYLERKISSLKPSVFWKIWSFVSTAFNLGLACLSLLVFWPRMTVDAENQIDPIGPRSPAVGFDCREDRVDLDFCGGKHGDAFPVGLAGSQKLQVVRAKLGESWVRLSEKWL
jgi:hypothetical protein